MSGTSAYPANRPAKPSRWFILVSVETQNEIRQIPSDASDLEGMALDAAANILYVNLRDKNEITRITLAPGGPTDLWSVSGMNLNAPLALDVPGHRLFVAERKPGKLFVLDTEGGKLLQTLESVEGADDLSFDATHYRLHISGAGGIGFYELQADGQYRLDVSFPNHGGKTSLFVPPLEHLYSVYLANLEDAAGLLVYKRMP